MRNNYNFNDDFGRREIVENIDIVYTWVDAADHIKNEPIKLGKDVNTYRMKNNNELLFFSLRSLENLCHGIKVEFLL